MDIAVPMIELADHADALGVRRPHRESRARRALAPPALAPALVLVLVPVPVPVPVPVRVRVPASASASAQRCAPSFS